MDNIHTDTGISLIELRLNPHNKSLIYGPIIEEQVIGIKVSYSFELTVKTYYDVGNQS
jgi:hypothetical protein